MESLFDVGCHNKWSNEFVSTLSWFSEGIQECFIGRFHDAYIALIGVVLWLMQAETNWHCYQYAHPYSLWFLDIMRRICAIISDGALQKVQEVQQFAEGLSQSYWYIQTTYTIDCVLHKVRQHAITVGYNL